jgi:VanZ family protein
MKPRILAVLAWICIIFFSSTSLASKWSEQAFRYLSGLFLSPLRPDSPPYGLIHLLADKSVHVALFCCLGILLWRALSNPAGRIPLILLLGAVVGSCSEILQAFFPGRDPAFRDVLINIGGTALGVAVCTAVSKRGTHRTLASPSSRRAQ